MRINRVRLILMRSSVILLTLTALPFTVSGGSLTPPGTPGPTMATLSEVKDSVDQTVTGINDVQTTVDTVEVKVDTVQSSVSTVSTKVDSLLSSSSTNSGSTPIGIVTINGQTQGDISKNANTPKSLGGLANPNFPSSAILLLNYGNGLVVPTDFQSGLPTSVPVFQTTTIVKYIDQSSPMLLNAVDTLEDIPTITIRLFRTSSLGLQEEYYRLTYSDAKIISVTQDGPNKEIIEFVFNEVIADHLVSAISGSASR